jgi:regulatory protein
MDLQERIEKYLALCYRYLTIRNRSEKEIRDYLQKKNADPDIIDAIVTRLYDQKFLNDEAFARSWVRSRAMFRPRGKRMLQIELQQKGISKDIIQQVLEEDTEDVPDEFTQAKNLIAKRVAKLQDEPRHIIYQKVGAFLARRGYSWDVSKKAIDEQLKREDENL